MIKMIKCICTEIKEIQSFPLFSLLENLDITLPHTQCNSNDKCNILTWEHLWNFNPNKKRNLLAICLFRRIVSPREATGQCDHSQVPGHICQWRSLLVRATEQLCNKPGLIEMRSLLSSTAGPRVQLDTRILL